MYVGETLQEMGLTRRTGALGVQKGEECGYIYLRHGRLIHADTGMDFGYPALFRLLELEKAYCGWYPDAVPSTETIDQSVEQALIDFLCLGEKAAHAMEGMAMPLPMSSEGNEKTEGGTKVPDLRNCAVSLGIFKGALEGQVLYLTKERTILGRSPTCDLILPDVTVSSRHVELMMDNRVLLLRDLGSTNGTAVNGIMQQGDIKLSAGDEIRMGGVVLHLNFKVRRRAKITQAMDPAFMAKLGIKSTPTSVITSPSLPGHAVR